MKPLWRAIEALAWIAFFVFATLVLALRFWLLPDIERYRGDIVAAIERSVGLPVKIGGIEAGWLGLRPQISLSDVHLYDHQGREVLALPSIRNVVSWRSLLYAQVRLHSLVVDGPRLDVRRDADGALYVAGMKLAADGERHFADWLLGQEEIVISNAEIEWRDEKRAAPPLALSALNLRLRNSGDQHSIGLTARPPEELGSSVELRAQLEGRSATDPVAWNGRLYAQLGYTDLAAWRAWIDYPLDVRAGQGALRVWATLENGRVREGTADVALSNVTARLAHNLAPLELVSVRGRLQGRTLRDGYEFSGRGVALSAENGPAIPATDFQLVLKPGATGADASGAAAANVVELEPLAQLAATLPLPADVRRLLADLQARGQVPGFSGLSGSIEASEAKGSVSLASRNAELDVPRIFPEPRIALETLKGRIDWERQGEHQVAVKFSSVSFANAHLGGNASGAYTYTGSGPGTIDLSAQLIRADGAQIGRYLPLPEIIGKADGNTGDFLKFIDATPVKRMTGGFTEQMSAVGKGKLHLKLELPIGNLAAIKVAGEYQFANNSIILHPQLPPVERATGKVSFTESTLTVNDVRGRLFGGPLAVSGGSRPGGGGIEVVAKGEATLAGVRPVFDSPCRSRKARPIRCRCASR